MAEAISIGAFVRMQRGLPYMSSLYEIPIYLNQYSPLYYLLHVPFLKVLPHSLSVVVLMGRCTSLLAGIAALRVTYLLGTEIYGRAFRPVPFSICAALMISAYPDLWNAVRPDLFSASFELIGILFFVKSVSSGSVRHRTLSASACGLAVALKLNQVGAAALIGVIILFTEDLRAVLLFMVMSVASALSALLIGYLWIGGLMFSNMAVAVQNSVVSPFELALNLSKLSQDLLLGLVPLFGAAALGLSRSLALQRPQRLILFLGLIVFFGLATVSQLKAGASVNYYHDFCFFLLVPAAWGLNQALDRVRQNVGERQILWCLLCLVTTLTVASLARRTLYDAVFMRRTNYPYAQVGIFLRMRHPGLKIYTDDSSAALHLGELSWLGPGQETILPLTPKLAPTIARLRKVLRASTPVGAIVATGAQCENARPSGLFAAELSSMTALEAKFGRICVFGVARN